MENVDILKGIVLPYFNFLLFLGALIFVARKPLGAMLLKRQLSFESALKEASAAKEEAAKRAAELRARLSKLETEVSQIKERALEHAQEEANNIVSSAESLAAHMRQEARRIADAELMRAKSSLREEIVSAVKEAVEKKVRSDLNSDSHLRIVRNQLGELKKFQVEGNGK